ncbi:hypothetical protein A3J90_07840 [candidate division WOR-1 bacterium RIFOXYC2_FULL_37_10]|nr:MAG: hypothetical protein A3J90_07840 [candidate division WOR-1 bacterium RIFOXYC2_FULL_37_10]
MKKHEHSGGGGSHFRNPAEILTRKTVKQKVGPICGLCGKTRNLTKTDCCGNWICDDEHKYKAFSYTRNSCHRNHSRYTLCAYHSNEGHEGKWQTCRKCRNSFETEMYVWYGTNEYNFVKLKNPPSYKPAKCAECETVIKLSMDGYSISGGKYLCIECSDKETENRIRQFERDKAKKRPASP